MRTVRALAIAVLFTAALAGRAAAFVQTRTDPPNNVLMKWPNSCVTLEILLGNPPSPVTADFFRTTAVQAATAWNPEATGCSQIAITITSSPLPSYAVAADKVNVVQFQRTFWGRDSTDPRKRVEYDRSALAITSVFAVSKDGTIVNTDVDINAVNYQWGDVVADPSVVMRGGHDLRNTLTHEFGHVLGLDHNCTTPAQPNLIGPTGAAAPACGGGGAEIRDATMFPVVMIGDSSRRDLGADDVLGICTLYPKNGGLNCPVPGNDDDNMGGCTIARRPSEPPAAGAAAALFFLALTARLRRRRRAE